MTCQPVRTGTSKRTRPDSRALRTVMKLRSPKFRAFSPAFTQVSAIAVTKKVSVAGVAGGLAVAFAIVVAVESAGWAWFSLLPVHVLRPKALPATITVPAANANGILFRPIVFRRWIRSERRVSSWVSTGPSVAVTGRELSIVTELSCRREYAAQFLLLAVTAERVCYGVVSVAEREE